MRACLFHQADAEQAEARERLAAVLQSAADDAGRRDTLRAAAPVEVAAHAALLQDWVGCAPPVVGPLLNRKKKEVEQPEGMCLVVHNNIR